MNKDTEGVVYEIGFHLIPLVVSEDEVASHVSRIRSILEEAGAEIVSEEYPKLIELAYPISKKIRGRKEDFTSAYFGWIKFTADPSSTGDIDEHVRGMEEVLRFIVVKTLRENTLLEGLGSEPEPRKEEETPSDETIDEAIEKLVVT
jgi:ribosomal protein S6